MEIINIEFFGDAGKVHNARFSGDKHANLEVLLGVLYEEIEPILKDINSVINGELKIEAKNDYDFGDFISGSISKDYVILKPDGIKSNTYKIKTKTFKVLIQQWLNFKAKNQNGVVKTVSVEAEVM